MENQSFPSDLSKWTWETIESLSDLNHPENTYLEYKQYLQYPGSPGTTESEWRQNVEREFTAFANASGGIIVFGMRDDTKPRPFEPPEHDISQTVKQYIHDTIPIVQTEVTTIPTPSEDTNRVLVAVRIHEAARKPVATSDSSFYVRINDQKQPMNREQVESRFVETDRRQQAVRQLEMELDTFVETYEETFCDYRLLDQPPDYHLIDREGLKEVFRENTHLYTDERTSEIIQSILAKLREIDSHERHYGRMLNGVVFNPYEDRKQMNKKTRMQFRDMVDKLYELVQQLCEQTDIQTP
ncbi:ATP-binding protein [Halorhabdus rudnickae]|uniref:ATP-binding protein n=1 Tax=Halorhabdus rudnickae TaxID=1775544 RepID=UPI0014383678|nr:ATP-binding protein [Halorhabdus rudnickae]